MRKMIKMFKNMPYAILLFWGAFFGVLAYEAIAVLRSYLETESMEKVVVPHVDALILVVLMAFVLRELQKRHRHLEVSKRFLQAMIDNIPYIVWMKDSEGRYVSVNEGFLHAAGQPSPDAAVGKNDFDIWPEEMARHYCHDDKEVMRSREKKELEEEVSVDGKRHWMHTYKTPVLDAEGNVIGTVGFARDITRKKEEQYKLQRFIDLQKEIVILTDGKKLDYANRALLEFFGFASFADFRKEYACICERFVAHDNFFHLGKVRPEDEHWIATLLNIKPEERTVSMIDGETEPHAFAVSINSFDDTGLFVVSFADISGTVIEKLELKNRALRDKLTGAFNRDYFEHYSLRTIEQFMLERKQSAVIFFDIDHFKRINDTYGHNAGDRVLQELVKTVKHFSRQSDTVVRWGGEEFLLLAPVESQEGAMVFAENVREKIDAHRFPGVDHVTCSFGATLYRGGERIDETIERADRALYQAKHEGRNRVVGI